MSLVEAGTLVGGVIGSPVSLDMKKVDGAPPSSTSRPPQQSALMGGGVATAPPARAAAPLAIKGPPTTTPTRGADTHTHTHTDVRIKVISRNQARTWFN